MVILFIYLKYRPETPPNTPQCARAAAHQNECDQHNLASPERHHILHNADSPPHIPPLQLPIPFLQHPIPQPFVISSTIPHLISFSSYLILLMP